MFSMTPAYNINTSVLIEEQATASGGKFKFKCVHLDIMMIGRVLIFRFYFGYQNKDTCLCLACMLLSQNDHTFQSSCREEDQKVP